MIGKLASWVNGLSASDWILLVTFLAIVWYSWETRQLRRWQKLQVLLTIFFEQTEDWDSGMRVRTKYPSKLQEIVLKHKYDPKWAYSTNWHLKSFKEKCIEKIKKIWF